MKRSFDEADKLGYLEADPQLDVGGIDAAHKLAILSSIAFGTQVDFDGIELEGIERVSIDDIRHAADMGYQDQTAGRRADDRSRAGTAHDALPRARHIAAGAA